MTAQPNDRAVEVVAEAILSAQWPDGTYLDGVTRCTAGMMSPAALAAIRDALARGGDDADAIAQAIDLPALIAQAKAEALREAADAWQNGEGFTLMLRRPQAGAVPAIDYAQRALDWLRARADRITNHHQEDPA